MKRELEILKMREVPEHLDASILAAARFSTLRRNRRNRMKRIIFAAGGMAAAVAAGFAVFAAPSGLKSENIENQYISLNELSSIEQEAFVLAAELNCRSIYALDTPVNWEN